jgi:hypothetical protein
MLIGYMQHSLQISKMIQVEVEFLHHIYVTDVRICALMFVLLLDFFLFVVYFYSLCILVIIYFSCTIIVWKLASKMLRKVYINELNL